MDEKEAEARPVMGTIFLVYNWASKASPTQGCSIEISRDIYVSVACQITWNHVNHTRANSL